GNSARADLHLGRPTIGRVPILRVVLAVGFLVHPAKDLKRHRCGSRIALAPCLALARDASTFGWFVKYRSPGWQAGGRGARAATTLHHQARFGGAAIVAATGGDPRRSRRGSCCGL